MKFIAILFLLSFNNPDIEVLDAEVVPLSGLVVEEATGEPIPGALVSIEGIEKEYYTDFEGYFFIDQVKPGNYNIEVSYISFDAKQLTEVRIDYDHNNLLLSLE